ncbi:MAG: hypothetical protein AB7O47_10150 [Flavobacteriales bacterium]
MNTKIIIPICVGIFSLLFVACNNACDKDEVSCSKDKKEVEMSPINPNGDSELALLMRKMYDDADAIKTLITNNEGNITQEYINELERIHTATPTEANVKTPEFEAYTKLMIEQANSLFSSETNRAEGFNSLVNRCVECHQSFCPGPIKKIRKLTIQ